MDLLELLLLLLELELALLERWRFPEPRELLELLELLELPAREPEERELAVGEAGDESPSSTKTSSSHFCHDIFVQHPAK